MVMVKQGYQQEIDALNPKTPRIQTLLDRLFFKERDIKCSASM